MLDGSRGTPSLENRLPIPKHWENVKEFGISWRKRWITQKAIFFGKRKLLAGARGKTSLEERFSISKCYCCVILIPGALDPDTNRSMAEPCKVSPPVSPPPKT
jgi:hypothetical protein